MGIETGYGIVPSGPWQEKPDPVIFFARYAINHNCLWLTRMEHWGAIALSAPAESFEPFEEGFKGWLDF